MADWVTGYVASVTAWLVAMNERVDCWSEREDVISRRWQWRFTANESTSHGTFTAAAHCHRHNAAAAADVAYSSHQPALHLTVCYCILYCHSVNATRQIQYFARRKYNSQLNNTARRRPAVTNVDTRVEPLTVQRHLLSHLVTVEQVIGCY